LRFQISDLRWKAKAKPLKPQMNTDKDLRRFEISDLRFEMEAQAPRKAAEASFGEEKAVAPFDFAPPGYARGRQGESYRTPKAACGCQRRYAQGDLRFEI
jgi:hypothetical protein